MDSVIQVVNIQITWEVLHREETPVEEAASQSRAEVAYGDRGKGSHLHDEAELFSDKGVCRSVIGNAGPPCGALERESLPGRVGVARG